MNRPYIDALNRPAEVDSLPLRKNDTVIGIIGNTQGVSSAANPHRIASMIALHSVPPPTGASGCNSGCDTTAESASGEPDFEGPVFGHVAVVALARTPVDIPPEHPFGRRQAYTLAEDDLALVLTDLLAEDFIETAFGCHLLEGIAHEFDPFGGFERDHRRREARMEIVGVPPVENTPREGDFIHAVADSCRRVAPLHGRGRLRQHAERQQKSG